MSSLGSLLLIMGGNDLDMLASCLVRLCEWLAVMISDDRVRRVEGRSLERRGRRTGSLCLMDTSRRMRERGVSLKGDQLGHR